jgi:hypothetical protein
MSTQEVTSALAIWGAVTGTIGTVAGLLSLYLRFKQHKQDAANLKCGSEFVFDRYSYPNHRIICRSVGRRPITIEAINYYILPKKLWQRLIKNKLHKEGKWVFKQELQRPVELTDGKKTEIKMSLIEGLEYSEIYRVQAVDQTGCLWSVEWPSPKNLNIVSSEESLFELEKEQGNRSIKILGCRCGERYLIETEFHSKLRISGGITGRTFTFLDYGSYTSKLDDIVDSQAGQYLESKADEIK